MHGIPLDLIDMQDGPRLGDQTPREHCSVISHKLDVGHVLDLGVKNELAIPPFGIVERNEVFGNFVMV